MIIGLKETLSMLGSLGKQVRFATMLALNDTAKDVQQFTDGKDGRSGYLKSKFTIRKGRGSLWSNPGNKFAFNAKRATKQNLFAVVGSQAPWLADQEHGGTRQHQAVPTEVWKPKAEALLKGKKVKTILGGSRIDGNRAFKAVGRAGEGVFVRTGAQRLPIKRLFDFETSIHVKPIFRWEPTAQKQVELTYQKNFDRRILEAIATAK